jgi:hypothetical protein
MLKVPTDVQAWFDHRIESGDVAWHERSDYRKWLRFYLDFCGKYGLDPGVPESLPRFQEKLASKHQSKAQRDQAGRAVNLYYELGRDRHVKDGVDAAASPGRERDRPQPGLRGTQTPQASSRSDAVVDAQAKQGPLDNAPVPKSRRTPPPAESPATWASWQAQYDAIKNAVVLRNYSPRTLKTYIGWTRKFQTFVRSKRPELLSTDDVKAFLTDLAVRQKVAGSTQNQAFNSLLFFFRHALGREFGKVERGTWGQPF